MREMNIHEGDEYSREKLIFMREMNIHEGDEYS